MFNKIGITITGAIGMLYILIHTAAHWPIAASAPIPILCIVFTIQIIGFYSGWGKKKVKRKPILVLEPEEEAGPVNEFLLQRPPPPSPMFFITLIALVTATIGILIPSPIQASTVESGFVLVLLNIVALVIIFYFNKTQRFSLKPPKDIVVLPWQISDKKDCDFHSYVEALKTRLTEEDIDLGKAVGANVDGDTYRRPGLLELTRARNGTQTAARREVEVYLDEYQRIKVRCEELIEEMMESIDDDALYEREDFSWRD